MMSENGNATIRFRRLTLALDASACRGADLDLAVELAELIGTELHGLFVEDADLLELAALPFAREVGRHSAQDRPLERGSLESILRSQVARAIASLEQAARARQLTVTSATARGKVVRQALELGAAGEILLLGDGGQRRTRGGSRARRGVHPVMTWFDAAPSTRTSLQFAASLARHLRSGLVIGFPARSYPDEGELRARFARWLTPLPSPMWLRGLDPPDVATLSEATRKVGAAQLVLAGEGPLAQAEPLERLRASIEATLILVR